MQQPRFLEVQRMYENPIAWIAILLAAPPWLWLVWRVAHGTHIVLPGTPIIGFWCLFGVIGGLLPMIFAGLHMRTVVTADELVVRFWPFVTRRFRLHELDHVEAVSYRPLLECGGWGLKWGRKWGSVLNVSGRRGVHVVARERRLLIGSRRADELADAIGRKPRPVAPRATAPCPA